MTSPSPPPAFDLDREALGRAVLRPARPRLEEALALVREVGDPRAAWEACVARGLVPEAWADVERRGPGRLCWGCQGDEQVEGHDQGFPIGMFPCTPCNGGGVIDESLRGVYSFAPEDGWSPELVAALASDPAGVERAEALAREVVARVRAERPCDARRTRWCVVRDRRSGRELRGRALADALYPAFEALTERDDDSVRRFFEGILREAKGGNALDVGEALLRRVARDVAAASAWRRCYGERPSPYEPLLALWASGYVLDGWSSTTLCLAAPAA